ncbi:hypothetical protein PLESTB_000552700 [Pleodorina starrii]|uniref:Uncharacterized protein n=1 Tax=Pleodorina starrii TaxID=330485 RepID=A0A9W6F161_9CHLO|nr:hypothetical protein PLESTB_000552700 [Pleodorina starrii]GLC77628.1 hypothetical protein PLESTF_001965100 [Pleodorina starrii]
MCLQRVTAFAAATAPIEASEVAGAVSGGWDGDGGLVVGAVAISGSGGGGGEVGPQYGRPLKEC